LSGELTVDIGQVFRAEYGRAVAVLARVFGDIDIAEDAVQDAFAAALTHWPAAGLPRSPAAWIITTARNRATDRLRREAARDNKHAQAALLHAQLAGDDAAARAGSEESVQDDRLRLIFTCCHPALGRPAQVALTLRLLGGLTTTEIAHAFLMPEPTMAQRLVRAKPRSATPGSPTGCQRTPNCLTACGPRSPWCISSSTRATRRAAATASSGPDSATRPSASAGCWPS
jgi:RNA polymerase sigma-70 factor (ECF subfamily)